MNMNLQNIYKFYTDTNTKYRNIDKATKYKSDCEVESSINI